MRVAVTGGTGFIGRALVENLSRDGINVHILTRRAKNTFPVPIHAFYGDLTDPNSCLGPFLNGVDTLYHCAGELRDPKAMRALHVDGTGRLIDAAKSAGIKCWVQLSSVGAYGPRRSGEVTEATPEAPVGDYETTKTEADAMVRRAALSGAFRARILRPANVIGHQMPNASIRHLIESIFKDRFVFFGPPGTLTNYAAVETVVGAMQAIAGTVNEGDGAAPDCQTYNLSQTCTLESFVAAICDGLGKPFPKRRIPYWLASFAAHTFGHLPGFPLTPSRLDALSSTVLYETDRLKHDVGYQTSVSITALARQMARDWRLQFADEQ